MTFVLTLDNVRDMAVSGEPNLGQIVIAARTEAHRRSASGRRDGRGCV